MPGTNEGIDFGGARGSNAGDQYHELWTLQQVLELLTPNTSLTGVGVEGVRANADNDDDSDKPTWDGVDCTLYYGGNTLETADHIEFVQLKYSSANPDTNWSISRITNTTSKNKNNSPIRQFESWRMISRMPRPELRTTLFSNYVSSAIKNYPLT